MKRKSDTIETIRSSKFEDKTKKLKLDSYKKRMFVENTQEVANVKIDHADMKNHHKYPQVPFEKSFENSNSDNKENVRPPNGLLRRRRDASNSVFWEKTGAEGNMKKSVGIMANEVGVASTSRSTGVNQILQSIPEGKQLNLRSNQSFFAPNFVVLEKGIVKDNIVGGVGIIVNRQGAVSVKNNTPGSVGVNQMIQDVISDSNSKLFDESVDGLIEESNSRSYYESGLLDVELTNPDGFEFSNNNDSPMPMVIENMSKKISSIASKDNSCGEAPSQIKSENMNESDEYHFDCILQELINTFEEGVNRETDYCSSSTNVQHPTSFDDFGQEENKPFKLLDEPYFQNSLNTEGSNIENINFLSSENNQDNKDFKCLYESDLNTDGWNFLGPNEENDYKPLFNQSNLDLHESVTSSAGNNYFQTILGHNETTFDLINGLDGNNKNNENYYNSPDESYFENKYSDTVQLSKNPSEFQPENDMTGNRSLNIFSIDNGRINGVFPNSKSGVLSYINNPKITNIPEILSTLNGSDTADGFNEFFDNSLKENENSGFCEIFDSYSLKENENSEQNSKITEDPSTDDLINMDFDSFFATVLKMKDNSDNSSNQQTVHIDDDDDEDSIKIITDLDALKQLNARTSAYDNDLVDYNDIIVVTDDDESPHHNESNNNYGNYEGHDENLLDIIVLTDDDCEIPDINYDDYGQENHDAQTDFYVNNDAQTGGYMNNDAKTDSYMNNDAKTDSYMSNDAQTDGYINNDALTDGYINNDAQTDVMNNDALTSDIHSLYHENGDVIIELPAVHKNIIDLTIDDEKSTNLFAKINTDFIKSEDNSSIAINKNSTYSFAENNKAFIKSEDKSSTEISENAEILNFPVRKRGRPKNSIRESEINLANECSPKKRAGRPKGLKISNNNITMVSVKKESFILCMGDYSCKICHKYHETFVELVKHCLTSHYNTFSNNYNCGVCNISENSVEKLMRHMENHEENANKDEKSKKHLFLRFKCPLCEEDPNQIETIYLSATIEFTHHLQNKHDLIVLGKCALCKQELPDQNTFLDHMIDRHALKNEDGSKSCPLCDSKKGVQKDILRIHLKVYHWEYEMKCSICNETLQCSKYTQHMLNDHVSIRLTEKPKFYRCVACLSGFSGLTKLTKHVCPKLTGLKCTYCYESYPSKKRLAFHMYLHWHKNNFPLECDICFEEFSDETACYNHIRFRHEYNKFVCKYCPKGFKDRVGYSIHQIYHTGNRNCKCKICGKCFYNNTTLKEHEVVHMKVKPHKCHICGAFLSRASRLRIHVKAHSIANNKNTQECFSCSKCRLVVTRKCDLSKHTCLSTDEFDVKSVILKQVYLCEFCGECFQDRDALHEHETVLHKRRDCKMPYSCQNCGMVFRMFSGLATHRLSHGITTESTTIKSNDNHSDDSTTGFQIPQLFSCERCSKTYSQYTVFNYHRKYGKHKDSTSTGNANERAKTTKSHFCRICKKLFVSPKSVEMHMRKKHGRDVANEKFICVTCGKQFLSKHALKMHLMVHSDDYIYCNICDINFKHPAALSSHIKRKHNVPVMKYFCEICKKGFEFPCDLENHVRTHTGDRPFKCEICGNCFISRQTFYQHVKAHLKNRKYDCACCDKSFISKPALMKHRREQLEILTCSICKIRFNSLNQLKIHNAEKHVKKEKLDSPPLKKKFFCPKCNKAYASSGWFRTHINKCQVKSANPQNTSWICSICFNIFTNNPEFNDHMKTHSAAKSYKDFAGLLFI